MICDGCGVQDGSVDLMWLCSDCAARAEGYTTAAGQLRDLREEVERMRPVVEAAAALDAFHSLRRQLAEQKQISDPYTQAIVRVCRTYREYREYQAGPGDDA